MSLAKHRVAVHRRLGIAGALLAAAMAAVGNYWVSSKTRRKGMLEPGAWAIVVIPVLGLKPETT